MKQCTCYALRAIDCTCKPAKYGELYTSPTAKQEQGEPLIWSTTQGGAYVCGEYHVVQRIDDKGWNAHKEHEHLLLGASLEDCKSICERDAVESLTKQDQCKPVAMQMDVIVVNLVREGINKHRARELAEHFIKTTTPQQRKPLTDEEIRKASLEAGMQEHYMGFHSGFIRFTKAIEAAHGIKE